MNNNIENFDFKKIELLNFASQKEYFTKYFVPLSNGGHCFLKDGQYEMITDEILNKVYLKRCGKKIKEYYTEDFKDIKTPVYQLNRPLFFDDKINLCPSLPTYKPFKDFDISIKNKVQKYLDYMKEILSSSDENVYKYLLKWNANMCKGNKNDSAIVLKTTSKGVGKSTHPTMMRKYVLGEKLSLETGSEPLKSKFNNILGGKLFVYFEELETFSTSEWVAVSCVLKRQITSDVIQLQKKGQDAFDAENINNYMLLSNHDVDDDGRRFFVADIATHKKGDSKYWDDLYKSCFNKEVGYALYCFFCEVNTDGFKPQDFPMTKNKLNSITKRLDSVYWFLKEKYILQNLSVDEKLSEFFLLYQEFCTINNKKACSKTDFISKLSEIQINFYKSNGFNKYKISLEHLKSIANKNNWINESDEFEEQPNKSPLDHGIDTSEDKYLSKIKELEDKIKQLEEENKKLKTKPEPEFKFDNIDDLVNKTHKKDKIKKEKKNKSTKVVEPSDDDLEAELLNLSK